jgi:hypothetical protein
MMAGMPVNRFHSFERIFFKDDIPVLQGITFPLKKTSFESGKIRLDKGAKVPLHRRLKKIDTKL